MRSNRHRNWIRASVAAAAVAVTMPMLAPTGVQAAKSNLGGGAVHGTTIFAAPGVPPVGQPCVPVSFEVEGVAPAFVMNTVITGYAGTIDITGNGTTDCTSATVSGGDLDITITGRGPTGSAIDCPLLEGSFTRAGVEVVVQLTGDCIVNQYGTGPVQFFANLIFTPLPPGAAVTQPVLQANFDGAFTVVPAQQ